MNYVGVDYHKKYSYMVVKNEDGRVERRGTVNNIKEEVQQFLEPYRPGMAVVEATRNWGLIYDWLDELELSKLAHLISVAKGELPAELILANAKVVNVFTGGIEPGNVVNCWTWCGCDWWAVSLLPMVETPNSLDCLTIEIRKGGSEYSPFLLN